MNKEVLISMVNSGKIRFIPLRRCSLCNEYIGYKFVRMYDGNTIPVFSSGCRCCGINIGTLSERTWEEVLDLVKMERKLILNSIEDAEIISVRLSPDETPIAYENRVRCLMLSGLSREEAEKIALEPMDLELYYEIGAGLMAVDPAAVESGTIWSPYTRELYHEKNE